MKSCNKCRFAKVDGEHLTCYRLPPAALLMPATISFLWPAVKPSSWCGEFKLAWKRLFRGHVST